MTNDGRAMEPRAFLFPKTTIPGYQVKDFTETNSKPWKTPPLNEPIFFQFLPRIDSDAASANYDALAQAIGRAEGMHTYKNSSNKALTLVTDYVADGFKAFGGIIRDEFWVQHQLKRLQALTLPIYKRLPEGAERTTVVTQNTRFQAPPLVLFTLGARYINVPVIITDVTAQQIDGSGLGDENHLPQMINVSIRMKTNYPYGFVPGYLDVARTFDLAQGTATRINPKVSRRDQETDSIRQAAGSMSYNANNNIQWVLSDSATSFGLEGIRELSSLGSS
jgi:hypothetical protein